MDCAEMRMCEFIESRATELENLLDRIQVISANNRLFQRLPKHIRRRAMSHNKKRLPRKLRDEAVAKEAREAKEAKEAKESSDVRWPSKAKKQQLNRKQRRRPSRLLAEFGKRQQRVHWLPTHIWHAKRFFMVEKWGFRIPMKTTERTFRANYRAQSAHRFGCQLIDVSYMRCVQVKSSNRNLLIRGLKQLLPVPSTQSQLFSESALRGEHMCEAVLYHAGRYPYGAIGHAELLWKPSASSRSDLQEVAQSNKCISDLGGQFSQRQTDSVWIWLHPVCLDEALGAMKETFSCEHAKMESEKESILQEVEVLDVSDRLARFRLTGNRAAYILRSVLEPSDDKLSSRNACQQSLDFILDAVAAYKQSQLSSGKKPANCAKLKRIAKTLFELKAQRCDEQSASQTAVPDTVFSKQPCDSAFAFSVRDPRLVRSERLAPQEAQSALEDQEAVQRTAHIAGDFSIWQHAENRENLLRIEPLKNGQMDEFRRVLGDAALRGSVIDAQVPVLVVRRSGYVQLAGAFSHDSVSVAPEWSLVVPLEFARSFWQALVHANVRTGGLHDLCYAELLRGRLGNPEALPDSRSGKVDELAACNAVRERELRRPPAKRRQFGEADRPLALLDFVWWKLFLGATSDSRAEDNELFYVLRDRCMLVQLDALMHDADADTALQQLAEAHRRALVPVSVCFLRVRRKDGTEASLLPVGHGVPQRFDLLHLPTIQDFSTEHAKCEQDEAVNTGLVQLGSADCGQRALIGQLKCGDFAQNRGHAIGLGFCSLSGLVAAARVSNRVRLAALNAPPDSRLLVPQAAHLVALLGNANLHCGEYRFVRVQLNYAEAV